MAPGLKFENQCLAQGYRCVAGVDEVGMGCLAGPVVAAAVILDVNSIPDGVDDCKKLSPKKRKSLSIEIYEVALAWSISHATVEEIDHFNIYHAAKLAMKRAVEGLEPKADFVLMDGRGKIDLSIPQLAIVKGDALSFSIGAASIIAKVYRDEWMVKLDESYPGYGLAKHKGYGSELHRTSLQKLGSTKIHRKSFSWTPVSPK